MHLCGPRSPRTSPVCRRPRNAGPALPAQTRRPEDQGNRWCKSQADLKSQEGWTSGLNVPPVNFPVPAHLGRVDFTVYTHPHRYPGNSILPALWASRSSVSSHIHFLSLLPFGRFAHGILVP